MINLKTPIVMKLKNSNCDETQKLRRKTQIVTKLKLWQNLNCDINRKRKTQQNSRTQIVKILPKLKLQPNWIMTKLHLWRRKTLTVAFSTNILTLWQPMRCSRAAFCTLAIFIKKHLHFLINFYCQRFWRAFEVFFFGSG